MRALIAVTCVVLCCAAGLYIAERLYKAFGPASITQPMRLT
jgi:hypothetical protein